ncbi:MAG: Shikimate 5-dehydrogenase I alpha [uncultured Cytophagales bacterium]|uniref:Shikimate 5-dehydrogenase I alpha n=1 Tax=uncultured Cytophagales bacterium TaxID=158755 RepID=A0A6J4LXT6_9SPHI|nr:MAG: Shikimate 5-dehydrogenase I alpha [uncultured Cytophagales bacterium]
MRLFGLIGYPLSHSFSKRYFTEKFAREGIADASYELFELPDIGGFPALLKAQPQLRGINVTIPHKLNVIPFLDALDDAAARIGAVNVIKVGADGRTTGYNSDYYGFGSSLADWFRQLHGEGGGSRLRSLKALILGSGGASKAVQTALHDMGIPGRIVSRQAVNGLGYDDLTPALVAEHRLLVNATPLGTAPNTAAFPPFPYDLLGAGHYLYDLVYNPPVTAFMQQGQARGTHVLNGLPMLHAQAEKSWEIWNG